MHQQTDTQQQSMKNYTFQLTVARVRAGTPLILHAKRIDFANYVYNHYVSTAENVAIKIQSRVLFGIIFPQFPVWNF